jgi:hypothetical protein
MTRRDFVFKTGLKIIFVNVLYIAALEINVLPILPGKSIFEKGAPHQFFKIRTTLYVEKPRLFQQICKTDFK